MIIIVYFVNDYFLPTFAFLFIIFNYYIKIFKWMLLNYK